MAEYKRATYRSSSKAKAGNGNGGVIARRFALLILLACWAFVFASLIGFNPADPPSHLVYPPNNPVANWCGSFGAIVSYDLFKLAGYGAWAFIVLLGLGLMSSAMGSLKHSLVRLIGLVMITAAVAGLQHLMFPHSGKMPDLAGGRHRRGRCGRTRFSHRAPSARAWASLSWPSSAALSRPTSGLLAAFGWMWEKTREHRGPRRQGCRCRRGSGCAHGLCLGRKDNRQGRRRSLRHHRSVAGLQQARQGA